MPDVNTPYELLLADVRRLRDDFRSLQLQASDREAPAYEDAKDMTQELYENALRREPQHG